MLSVIGFPRTGFTLLISIIIELRRFHGIQKTPQISSDRVERMERFKTAVPKAIDNFLQEHSLSGSLILTQIFITHLVVLTG